MSRFADKTVSKARSNVEKSPGAVVQTCSEIKMFRQVFKLLSFNAVLRSRAHRACGRPFRRHVPAIFTCVVESAVCVCVCVCVCACVLSVVDLRARGHVTTGQNANRPGQSIPHCL